MWRSAMATLGVMVVVGVVGGTAWAGGTVMPTTARVNPSRYAVGGPAFVGDRGAWLAPSPRGGYDLGLTGPAGSQVQNVPTRAGGASSYALLALEASADRIGFSLFVR